LVPQRLRRLLADGRGFTLTELVVVVAVVGIIMAVSVPALWTYFRSAALRGGAEEAVSVLNNARQLAIRLNTTVCVTNTGGNAQFHVGSCGAAAWTGPGTTAAGNIGLANNLTLSGTNNLCFNYLGAGTATPNPCVANGTLTVTNPVGGATMNVVMATTGRIRIQ
jgi:prepilin-type N-terminal cleavage/methylation domain-containing protein